MLKINLSLNPKIKFSSSLLVAFILLSSAACTSQNHDSSAEYVRPYQQQSVPIQPPNGYYYRSNPTYGYPPVPASRYYSNPYAFPPQSNYPYYDGDQYYRPPSAYGTSDAVMPPGDSRF